MLSSDVTQGQRSDVNISAVSFACIILIVLLIILYLVLHWKITKAGSNPFFYLDSFGGKAFELAFWSSLGILIAGLGRLAKIMITYPPNPFSMRHILRFAVKNTLMAWAAMAMLGFATSLLLFFVPALEWIAAGDKLLLAAALIPASFLLGLYGNVANSFFLGVRDGVKRQGSQARKRGVKDTLRSVWKWLKSTFIKTLWLNDSKETGGGSMV